MNNNVPTFNNPFQFDMLMTDPVHAMMHEGILIDPQIRAKHIADDINEWAGLQGTLDKIVGKKVNVEGKKTIPQLLYDEIGITKRTKKDKKTGKVKVVCDEEAIRSIMAECKEKVDNLKTASSQTKWMTGYVVCFHILKIRGIRKRLSSFLGVKIKKGSFSGLTPFTDSDGKIRGTVSVGGTETARFSHSRTLWETGINLATVPRKLRSMFIADEGYELAEFDLNRGESWVYAHLSEDPELLRIHTEGLDFHAETASAISSVFGGEFKSVDWIIEHKEGEGYKLRFVGKKNNHATAYRMGPYLATDSVNAESEETGITVTMPIMKKAQELWHNKYFMVKSNWWPEIEREIKDKRLLKTPYGRIHQFNGLLGDELYKSATAYVPQSTSVDYLNRGFLKVFHNIQRPGLFGLKVLAQTHDSILVKYKRECRDEVVPMIADMLLSELTIKKRTFTIPVEASYGNSWGTTKKYKLAS